MDLKTYQLHLSWNSSKYVVSLPIFWASQSQKSDSNLNVATETEQMLSGVPQGLILGPLLLADIRCFQNNKKHTLTEESGSRKSFLNCWWNLFKNQKDVQLQNYTSLSEIFSSLIKDKLHHTSRRQFVLVVWKLPK